MTKQTVFAVFNKADCLVGVFSTLEKAEKARELLTKDHCMRQDCCCDDCAKIEKHDLDDLAYWFGPKYKD